MNINIFHTDTETLLKQGLLYKLLDPLPASIQSRALRYQSESSRYNFVAGRLLFQRGLNHYDLDYHLEELAYNQNGKPLLPGIHFNISHSRHLAICAFSQEGILGIDLEKIQVIDFTDFTTMFSNQEWDAIKSSKDPIRSFYWFWTRKESIIKALGRNLSYLHQIELDVTLDHFEVEGKRWFLRDFSFGTDYVGAICSEHRIEELEFVEVKLD